MLTQEISPADYAKVHYNWPQRRGALVRARKECLVASRGFGKTTGVFAERVSHNVFALRRSLGGMVMPSYKKFLTQFIPAFKEGLQMLGYEKNRDYTIGKEGPAGWAQPYKAPEDWSHAMHWRNGSGIVFISQDGLGAGNGHNLDWIAADEAKLLNGERFENETVPAMRGNRQHFEGCSEHGSILICSDRPVTAKEKWFYTYRKKMSTEMHTAVRLVLQIQMENQVMREAIAGGRLTAASMATYRSEITTNDRLLNEIRKDLVYYHEATVLDNIDVYGLAQLQSIEKSMSQLAFDTAMLNLEVDAVEGGFYPDLDLDVHGYDPAVSSWTTARGYDDARLSSRSSLHDVEIATNLPLEIAMDYGGRFNCMVIGQMYADTLRIDNGLYAVSSQPEDVANDFVDYYKPHGNKKVYYHYDHTANQYGDKDKVIAILRKGGWDVVQMPIGVTPAPKLRMDMWSAILRMRDKKPVTFNRVGAADITSSMSMCQLREGKSGLEKNKGPEAGALADQVHAPHFSDACDTLVWGRVRRTSKQTSLPAASVFVS